MAVRRLTRSESKTARANLPALRAAGGEALLEWLIGFERCDVSTFSEKELNEIRHDVGRFTTVRDGVVLAAKVLSGNKTVSRTTPESTGHR